MTTGSDVILDRMMTLHPKVIDLTLDRVHRLLAALGHPERRLPPVIHIAGTNGKGSTQAMIRAGLEAEGKAVHAYTSPHLARFHERIRLAGELISEPALTALLDECVQANGGEEITFFEITTCAAFAAFALICLGMVLTPGPNMVYLISRSICQGPMAGLISLGGVALGFVFLHERPRPGQWLAFGIAAAAPSRASGVS